MLRTHLLTILAIALCDPCAALVLPRNVNNIQWIDCESSVPQPLQGVALPTTLPSTLHCGRLDVPMDYSQPFSTNNKITLGFAMYRPSNPKGLVNYNPGGPGLEVASYAWEVALNLSSIAPYSELQDFDFLAMDVRGTHTSNPLNCTLEDLVIPSSFPTNEAEFEAYQAPVKTYAQSCIDHSTPQGIVAHVGTAETAQDWDSLREALGYDKMHFIGLSAGTAGGITYASKFPQNVGRFVLDAIIPPGISNLDLITSQIKAANRLLLRADAYCIYDPTCPFHSNGKGSVVQAFSDVLQQALAGNSSGVTVDDVRAAVNIGYLSSNPDFPAFNLALHGALNGNWSALSYANLASSYTPNFATALQTLCLDQHIDDNTFSGFDAIRQSIAKVDTAQMSYVQVLSIVGLCGGWPYHGNSQIPLPTDAPMLLVTADFDLNTPTEWATFEWTQAPNAALVVRHGDDHGTIGTVDGPAQLAEVTFIATGNLPSATDETLVTIYTPGMERGPIADPYTAPIGPAAGDTTSVV
ncbi:hypothetical protein BOTBODRAFT_443473 [Botryobasidium botryosum FD-172 SS1]|uniref:AB hydrolase-1 domain-containing protein n=1 Tax=Botryobasidium botryosum (strain FD-172 SS1) TaxID=930990 RepID=A0A067MVE5_BOTB1|nr:hypothetical protein BOTBODRAFT_443473 [Botryobasidium botryosum FD-172 SS1]